MKHVTQHMPPFVTEMLTRFIASDTNHLQALIMRWYASFKLSVQHQVAVAVSLAATEYIADYKQFADNDFQNVEITQQLGQVFPSVCAHECISRVSALRAAVGDIEDRLTVLEQQALP